jgi:hypothetical protein
VVLIDHTESYDDNNNIIFADHVKLAFRIWQETSAAENLKHNIAIQTICTSLYEN